MKHTFSWQIASAAVIFAIAQGLHAQTCPTPSSAPAPTLEQLQEWAPHCLQSPEYYRELGAALFAKGQTWPALQAFERALLLQPEHPGAQLDYAMALLAQGDTASAATLLRQLHDRDDLPAHLQPLLAQQLSTLQQQQSWLHRVSLSASAVADSNLNNAPLGNELTLTLPQGTVTLPIGQAYQRQSGTSALAQAQWTALLAQGQQLWSWQSEVRQRQHPNPKNRYTQLDMAASWLQAPEAPTQWLLRGSYNAIEWGGQHLFAGLRGSAQHQWALAGGCRASLGVEMEQRHYPLGSGIDGRYSGLTAVWLCQLGTKQWQLQSRIGKDNPTQAQRPGGPYQQNEWRAAWQDQVGPGVLVLDYQLAQQQDGTGYSPLLSANATRQQRRQALGVEYTAPLPTAAAWQWFVALETSRQHSNLSPFASARQALSSGVRWSSR